MEASHTCTLQLMKALIDVGPEGATFPPIHDTPARLVLQRDVAARSVRIVRARRRDRRFVALWMVRGRAILYAGLDLRAACRSAGA